MPEPVTTPDATSTATTTATPAAPTTATVTPTATDTVTVESLTSEIKDLKAKFEAASKWEPRAKGNSDKASKFDQLLIALGVEDKGDTKTDIESVVADLQKKIADNETRATRAEIVSGKNLNAAQAAALAKFSGTAEELAEFADLLIAATGNAAPATPANNSANANGNLGTNVSEAANQLTLEDFQKLSAKERLTAVGEGRTKTIEAG